MNCHAAGLQKFTDVVNKNAADLPNSKKLRESYPPLDDAYTADQRRFADAFSILPAPPVADPLRLVADGFKLNPGTGRAFPLDALTAPDNDPADPNMKVELTIRDASLKPAKVFNPGQKATIVLKNSGQVKCFYELVLTNVEGYKIILRSDQLEPGREYSLANTMGSTLGLESCTVFASKEKLPPAVPLLLTKDDKFGVRLVHPLYKIDADGRTIQTLLDAARVAKKTIAWETVAEGSDK
jgi:hypothetical protein